MNRKNFLSAGAALIDGASEGAAMIVNGIRVSFHICNRDADVDTILAALKSFSA